MTLNSGRFRWFAWGMLLFAILVLLLRRTRATKQIEYCWFTDQQHSRGLIDDPLVGAGITGTRSPGTIKPGDWLFQGGRKSIYSNKSADFEVRIALEPPSRE